MVQSDWWKVWVTLLSEQNGVHRTAFTVHLKPFYKLSFYFQLLLIVKTLHLSLRWSFYYIVSNLCWSLFQWYRFNSKSLQGSADLAPFCLQQIASVPKQVPFNQCPYFLCQICSLFIDGIKCGYYESWMKCANEPFQGSVCILAAYFWEHESPRGCWVETLLLGEEFLQWNNSPMLESLAFACQWLLWPGLGAVLV